MKAPRLKLQLTAAHASRALVRIHRTFEEFAIDGVVVGLGERWLLMLIVADGANYAGFQAFRYSDIEAVDAPSPRATFLKTALRLRGSRRPVTPRLDLSSTQALLDSAGRRFTLVTIHREKVDAEICQIGSVVATTTTSVSLREITPDADWEDEPTTYRLSEITRVDLGGPYEDALALVAASRSR